MHGFPARFPRAFVRALLCTNAREENREARGHEEDTEWRMRCCAINQLFADLPRYVTFLDACSIMNQLLAIPANAIFGRYSIVP